MKTTIWWVRRDLRLSDNQALTGALKAGNQVLPVFVLDQRLLRSPYCGEKRLDFLFDGLRELDISLRKRGSSLVVRRGDPVQVLAGLMNEVNADAVYAEEDYSPFARSRDETIANQIPLQLFGGLTVQHPNMVVKPDGLPYTVFSPFKKAWLSHFQRGGILPAPEVIPSPAGIRSEAIPDQSAEAGKGLFKAGEERARFILENFADHSINDYTEARNRVDLDGTSGLSSYLRFGMLSARQAVESAWQAEERAADRESRNGAETWLNELIWREFYQAVLYHFPDVRKKSFRKEFREMQWLNREEDFSAWTQGQSGYPVVDAAMRQLLATGWMHNRARMIVASFLTKDLLIDWRWGEKFFMQHLVDGDPAANNGGWQWAAGTGTDAAPYFRVFNPILQGKKFDPTGDYVRRWVPELANVPDGFIHSPWLMPNELQLHYGVKIGTTYPAPIVEHGLARQRALDAYKRCKIQRDGSN
jgi:deoxyribodipyrimidine photo-lyase